MKLQRFLETTCALTRSIPSCFYFYRIMSSLIKKSLEVTVFIYSLSHYLTISLSHYLTISLTISLSFYITYRVPMGLESSRASFDLSSSECQPQRRSDSDQSSLYKSHLPRFRRNGFHSSQNARSRRFPLCIIQNSSLME